MKRILLLAALFLATAGISAWAQTITYTINEVTTTDKAIGELSAGDLANASSISMKGIWDQTAINKLKSVIKNTNGSRNNVLQTVDMSAINLTANSLNELFVSQIALRQIIFPTATSDIETSFNSTFKDCWVLHSADLSRFTKITDISFAFENSYNLRYVEFGVPFTQFTSTQSVFLNANPNCLAYVPFTWRNDNPWTDTHNQAYILKQNSAGSNQYTAMQSIILSEASEFENIYKVNVGEGNTISYVRFLEFTPSGDDNQVVGWSTICLPFKVVTITGINQKGQPVSLTPYKDDGSYEGAGTPGIVPFWLRTLDANGYKATDVINDTPAIISIPSVSRLGADFEVTGDVTFTSEENASLFITEPKSTIGPDYVIHSNYESLPPSQGIYVTDEPGTAFVANKSYAFSFYPYAKALIPDNAPDLFAIKSGTTSIEELLFVEDGSMSENLNIYTSGKTITIESGQIRKIKIHGIDGRTIRIIQLQEGTNNINDLKRGVYIIEGRKVII